MSHDARNSEYKIFVESSDLIRRVPQILDIWKTTDMGDATEHIAVFFSKVAHTFRFKNTLPYHKTEHSYR